jgi:hypothetical protein
MSVIEHPRDRSRVSPWTVCVCFFLATLFLYNPFFTFYGSSSVLKVQHPHSYRGTVASSELRRSRVTEVQPKVFSPEEAILESVVPSAPPTGRTRASKQEPLEYQPQMFSEDLWFRPPPVS